MDPINDNENDVEIANNADDSDIELLFDDERKFTFGDRLNMSLGHYQLNERQKVFWAGVCIHPTNCDHSQASILEMTKRFQDNPGNLTKIFRGHSALSDALRNGHPKCAEFLINSHTDRSTLMPFNKIVDFSLLATTAALKSILEMLLKNELFDPSQIYSGVEEHPINTIFTTAIEMNNFDLLQGMIELGIPFDTANTDDFIRCRTPVFDAIVNVNPTCYRFLLRIGAQNRVLTHDDAEDSENRKFIEYPIPILLIISAISVEVNKPYQVIEMMKIFREFGGNLWTKAPIDFKSDPAYADDGKERVCKAGQNALEFLKSDPELLAKFPTGTIEELQQLMETPLSFMELSRLQILRTMGKDYLKNIPHLWLPREVKKFLEF